MRSQTIVLIPCLQDATEIDTAALKILGLVAGLEPDEIVVEWRGPGNALCEAIKRAGTPANTIPFTKAARAAVLGNFLPGIKVFRVEPDLSACVPISPKEANNETDSRTLSHVEAAALSLLCGITMAGSTAERTAAAFAYIEFKRLHP